jgi:hypothetical protein
MIITEFNKFNKRNVVSFDFDGVLHLSMIPGTIHPADWINYKTWIPSKKLHGILKKEHQNGNKIIVISARDKKFYDFNKPDFNWDSPPLDMKKIMMKFMKLYQLPVDDIILTDNGPKKQILIDMKAIRHYDDNIDMERELKDTNIEFVYVYNDKIVRRIKNKGNNISEEKIIDSETIGEIQKHIADGTKNDKPILTPDGKNVYVIRAVQKGEFDHVMNKGGVSGTFWGTEISYRSNYYFIKPDSGYDKSWSFSLDFNPTISNWPDEPRIEKPNPNYRLPNKLIDHFQEVGRRSAVSLEDISYILDSKGEIVYDKGI